MPPTSSNDGISAYGLTAREIELVVKAMITLVEDDIKPNFAKLASITTYPNATAARKTWALTAKKLKAAAAKPAEDTKAGSSSTVKGNKAGKRPAGDIAEGAPVKRGRGRPKKIVEESFDLGLEGFKLEAVAEGDNEAEEE